MRNGITSSLSFLPLNREKENVADLPRLIVGVWSMRSSTWFAPVVPWRLLPRDFGRWETVYGCFRRWSQDWTWTFIHDTLRDYVRKTEERKVAPTAAIIDSQSVKIADQAGRARLRRSEEGVGAQTPRGSGLPGIDIGDYDHASRCARPLMPPRV